jgi:predicted nuclease with RNAse H fold
VPDGRFPAAGAPAGHGGETVGVDLAAEATRTAVAWIDWSAAGARVRGIELGADDDLVVAALMAADKAGVDCPLGWPDRFVEFVAAHRAGRVDVPRDTPGRDWRRDLALRVTDQVTRELTGLIPLSVSADRIGHAAMRCAALLARLADRGRPVERDGRGVVVEVYPAASLKAWGLPYRGYKRARHRRALGDLLDGLRAAAPWLDLGAAEPICRSSDDATDAVIAALTARAAALGRVTTPAPEHRAAAASEGWIALPTGPLADLGDPPAEAPRPEPSP